MSIMETMIPDMATGVALTLTSVTSVLAFSKALVTVLNYAVSVCGGVWVFGNNDLENDLENDLAFHLPKYYLIYSYCRLGIESLAYIGVAIAQKFF